MMPFPKIKHAMLCRILVYVVVIGGFLLPPIALLFVPGLPGWVGGLAFLAMTVALVAYIFQNFLLLMGMDAALAALHCKHTARRSYPLPERFQPETLRRRVALVGRTVEPTALRPQPALLRCRVKSSWTVYAKGIETVLALYTAPFLDAESYREIVASARANSKALKGRLKPLLLDPSQKGATLHRVTIAYILADSVDARLWAELLETLKKQAGDSFEESVLPCVIDLGRRRCVFDGERIPYLGFIYPVKNRGIRLIRRTVFGGRLPLRGNPELLTNTIADIQDEEMSLWAFWRYMREEARAAAGLEEKRFREMKHGDIRREDELLTVRWEARAAMLLAEESEDGASVTVERPDFWSYPKTEPISREDAGQLQRHIEQYYKETGRRVSWEES